MQVCLGNEFRLATPLQWRLALHDIYYLDTEADTCMKAKIIVIYHNTSYYTHINTLYMTGFEKTRLRRTSEKFQYCTIM